MSIYFVGHYMYVEASYPRKQGDNAMLASFPIDGSSPSCSLSFWSHMKGDHVGSLAVLLRFSYGNGAADYSVIKNITGKGDYKICMLSIGSHYTLV